MTFNTLYIPVCLLLFFQSCQNKTSKIDSVHFNNQSIHIRLNQNEYVHYMTISRSDTLVKRFRLNRLITDSMILDLDWLPSQQYTVMVTANSGEMTKTVNSPDYSPDRNQINLSIPFGQQKISLTGEHVDTVYLYSSNAIEALLQIDMSQTKQNEITVQLTATDSVFDNSNKLRLTAKSANQRTVFKLFKLNNSSVKRSIELHYNIRQSAQSINGTIVLINKNSDDLNQLIRITQINHSSSASGFSQGNENPNTLFLNNSFFSQIQAFFGQTHQEFNTDNAYNYTAIQLHNSANFPIVVIGDMEIHDLDNKVANAFLPRDLSTSTYSSSSKSSIQIPANSTTYLTIPLYVDHLKAVSGEYKKRIRLNLFGYSEPFFDQTYPLYLNESFWKRFSIYLSFVFAGLVGLVLFFRFYRKYIHNFPVAILITTAIFAAIHFTFSYIVFLLDSTFFAILGPFRTFISSLISEGISTSILIALLLVYPQRGVVSLKLLISFLIGAVLTGSLYLHNIPGFGLKILVLESALIMSGFYILSSNTKKRILTAFSLAIAQSIMAYFMLLENQVLFRLFYADWYIWTFVFVTGFVYPFSAVFLSWNLGLKLKQVIR